MSQNIIHRSAEVSAFAVHRPGAVACASDGFGARHLEVASAVGSVAEGEGPGVLALKARCGSGAEQKGLTTARFLLEELSS